MEGAFGKRDAQLLVRQIKVSINENRKQKPKQAVEATVVALKAGDLRDLWWIIQAWHREASDFAAKPCYAIINKLVRSSSTS